jgi:hypothetical protein
LSVGQRSAPLLVGDTTIALFLDDSVLAFIATAASASTSA